MADKMIITEGVELNLREFKQAAGMAPRFPGQVLSEALQVDAWYKQSFRGGDVIYFVSQRILKNGNAAGLMVRHYDGGRPEKAKKTSVAKMDAKLWKQLDKDDIPPSVMKKFKARMESIKEAEAQDWNEFNTKLSKLTKKLRKDAGAKSIRQNYKGTGNQKARRQLWINFKNGAVLDIWLDKGWVQFGGVVARHPAGDEYPSPRIVKYEGKTPEQVYEKTKEILKAWADRKQIGECRLVESKGLTWKAALTAMKAKTPKNVLVGIGDTGNEAEFYPETPYWSEVRLHADDGRRTALQFVDFQAYDDLLHTLVAALKRARFNANLTGEGTLWVPTVDKAPEMWGPRAKAAEVKGSAKELEGLG